MVSVALIIENRELQSWAFRLLFKNNPAGYPRREALPRQLAVASEIESTTSDLQGRLFDAFRTINYQVQEDGLKILFKQVEACRQLRSKLSRPLGFPDQSIVLYVYEVTKRVHPIIASQSLSRQIDGTGRNSEIPI
ncbi:uncharacterized protein BROUX77_007356 [Berkeleyomyces rouxiae]|uniref:uncharacterized protein n=1 Tax=Berkeleyomyces rouxiae TaxID=2035830 RepID=UPI003B7BF509